MRKLVPLVMALTFWVIISGFVREAQARKPLDIPYHYHYISLDNAELPSGFSSFFPAKVVDGGQVYGTASRADDPNGCAPSAAVWQKGKVTVLDDGFVTTANNKGVIAVGLILDCATFKVQAALLNRNSTEFIPPLPGEVFSSVLRLTDSGIALVESYDADSNLTRYLYRRGHVTSLNLGGSYVNDSGLVAGTFAPSGSPFDPGTQAFRYRPPSSTRTLLPPRPTEPISWAQGINKRGDVLGYSFVSGGREAIGVWRNRPNSKFSTYFVEGTPEFPTVSNRLLWNEPGLIVITFSFSDPNSYIVPRRGVRINLADITDRARPASWVTVISDLNNKGDLIGYNYDPNSSVGFENFLLQRVPGPLPSVVAAAPSPQAVAGPRKPALPPRLGRILHDPRHEVPEIKANGKSANID
jgi:hypothetical protein